MSKFITNRGKKFEEQLANLQCKPIVSSADTRQRPLAGGNSGDDGDNDDDLDLMFRKPRTKSTKKFSQKLDSELLDILKSSSNSSSSQNACVASGRRAPKQCSATLDPDPSISPSLMLGLSKAEQVLLLESKSELSSLSQQRDAIRSRGSRRSRRSKCKQKDNFVDDDDDDDDDDVVQVLDSPPKQESEVVLLDSPLSSCDNSFNNSFQAAENLEKTLLVKFKYKGNVARILFNYDDCFWLHISSLMKLLNIPNSDELIIFHNDKRISFDETPKTLGLTVVDILECIVHKNTNALESTESDADDSGRLIIKLRSNLDARNSRPIVIKINPSDHMRTLMEEYSRKVGRPLETMCFKFDGEKITGDETPDDLELENNCLVEVLIKS